MGIVLRTYIIMLHVWTACLDWLVLSIWVFGLKLERVTSNLALIVKCIDQDMELESVFGGLVWCIYILVVSLKVRSYDA